jgi:hypothetical protein
MTLERQPFSASACTQARSKPPLFLTNRIDFDAVPVSPYLFQLRRQGSSVKKEPQTGHKAPNPRITLLRVGSSDFSQNFADELDIFRPAPSATST